MTERQLDPWDRALLAALSQPLAAEATEGQLLTLSELAERTGLSPVLLEALHRQGLVMPRRSDPEPRYDPTDVDAVRAGLELVEAGLPLAELLDLARLTDQAMRPVAEEAVERFARFVRDQVEATAETPEEAAQRLVSAFRSMLPATGRLVAHHFGRLLVEAARQRLEAAES